MLCHVFIPFSAHFIITPVLGTSPYPSEIRDLYVSFIKRLPCNPQWMCCALGDNCFFNFISSTFMGNKAIPGGVLITNFAPLGFHGNNIFENNRGPAVVVSF